MASFFNFNKDSDFSNHVKKSLKLEGNVSSKEIKAKFDRVLKNEALLSDVTKDILRIVSGVSEFDVGIKHISKYLSQYAGEMSAISEENLSTVEEITVSVASIHGNVEKTTNDINVLLADSDNFRAQNQESNVLLQEINQFKDTVISDTNVLSEKISSLIQLSGKIESIVDSVQSIADQTNLLALNAAIEAARSGEAGRGFAVVATEIRNLADNTTEQLNGMRNFVTNIKSVADEGNQSLESTLESINIMSGKIDQISETIKNNSGMVKNISSSIEEINVNMSGIANSTEDISQVIGTSAEDAQKISQLSLMVDEKAKEALHYIETVETIDSEMSNIASRMMEGLHGSPNNISNEEFIKVLHNAKNSHQNWVNKLENMVNTMSVNPIQTSSHKCGFGHFYHTIVIKNSRILEAWNKIDSVHKEIHQIGDVVIDAIEREDSDKCNEYLAKAKELSKIIGGHLDNVENIVKDEAKGSSDSVF